jgi:hypothetical protein
VRAGPLLAVAAAALAGAGWIAWQGLRPGPSTPESAPAAAPSRAAREADDVVDAVRRGRLSAALAGIVAFLRHHDPADLDGVRRAEFGEARVEAGRWGLTESLHLAEGGEVAAAESLLAKAVRALEGTAAEGEVAAVAAKVRALAEKQGAKEAATARAEAMAPAAKAVAAAKEKGAKQPEAALADLLEVLQVTTDPEARKAIEKEVARLQGRVRAKADRAEIRRKADQAIQAGEYEKARGLLKSLVDGAEAAGADAAEAARDAEKMAAVKDLEENKEPEALAACRKGLRWLVKQQLADGSFSLTAKGDDGKVRTEEERTKAKHRTGTTGLCTLALLGHVRYDVTDEFAAPLAKSLAWLGSAQKSDGSFPGDLYGNSIATLALVEADRLLHRTEFRPVANKALKWLLEAQNTDGGWWYQPRVPPSDVSVSGWAIQAILHAQAGAYEIPQNSIDLSISYLDRMTDPVSGAVAYRVPGQGGSRAMTAASLFCRLRYGQGPDDPRVKKAADSIVASTADRYWATSSYGVFYASDAMSRLGGDYWRKWSPFLKKTLLPSQLKEGDAEGAWPSATDVWGNRPEVGAVVVAALNCISLENFFEHRE